MFKAEGMGPRRTKYEQKKKEKKDINYDPKGGNQLEELMGEKPVDHPLGNHLDQLVNPDISVHYHTSHIYRMSLLSLENLEIS